jgi:hypothetical protein
VFEHCEQIKKARTRDEMAEAIDLALHVPESDQGVVNEALKGRLAALKAAPRVDTTGACQAA